MHNCLQYRCSMLASEVPSDALYVPQPRSRGHRSGKDDDPPSAWAELLAANAEEVCRVELQWAAGSGSYRTARDYNAKAIEVQNAAGGDRYQFMLDDGQYGPVALASRLWSDARDKFDDENAKRDGVLREIRVAIAAYGQDGKLFSDGTKMHPLTESAAAGPVELYEIEDGDRGGVPSAGRSFDYQAAGIMREQRAHGRELTGTVHSLLSRIEGMASNIGQLVDGVVAQSAVALQLQQAAIDRERERVEEDRDAAISTAFIDRGFDMGERYLDAFFIMKGVDPETFGGVDPTTSTPVKDTCAKLSELLDDMTWSRLLDVHAEVFGDLRNALQLDAESELRAALTVALPPVRQHGAAALPLLPAGVVPLLERLRQLVFPKV